MKTGLREFAPSPTDINLSAVYSAAGSAVPSEGGVRGLEWGGLGNFEYGDCYFASAAHEVEAEAHLAGRTRSFTDKSVLTSYANYLGLPSLSELDEQTDRGTDAREGARYRRQHGVLDAAGRPAHIGAYAFETDAKRLPPLIQDLGGVTVCVELLSGCESEFRTAEEDGRDFVWDVSNGGQVAGGHAIAGTFWTPDGLGVVSWGREGVITWDYLAKYMQTTVVYFSGSVLHGGVDVAGLNKQKLIELVREVRGG